MGAGVRLRLALAVMVASPLCGQFLLDPALHPKVVQAFETAPTLPKVPCRVRALPPRPRFTFRLQAGYRAELPMRPHAGEKHVWTILTRITPQQPGAVPTYLGSEWPLPPVPATTKESAIVSGGYLLGEGEYRVEWLLLDDQGRACQDDWKVRVRRAEELRAGAEKQPPFSVRPLSSIRWDGNHRTPDRPRRVTVLLHAAPVWPFSRALRDYDVGFLMGTLLTLLEQVPFTEVRLVAFNLDQLRVLYRSDQLGPEGFTELARAITGQELGTVDIDTLNQVEGHWTLLEQIVRGEQERQTPSDLVLFVGPTLLRHIEKPPRTLREALKENGGLPVLYLEHQSWYRGGSFPDVIAHLTRALGGRRLVFHNPRDLGETLEKLE